MPGKFLWVSAIALAVLAGACGESPATPSVSTALLGVAPPGGATRVDPGSPIVLSFSHPMMAGMERYVELHEGDVMGPVVPGAWTWSTGRNQPTLTFTPTAPLKPATRYTIHLGGGVRDASGRMVDYQAHGQRHMGGEWATGGMMGSGGGGQAHMGADWRHANGTYGMVFSFTTE